MSKKIWLPVMILFLLSSCQTARKTGMVFNSNAKDVSVFVVPPSYIQKTNLKKYPTEGLKNVSQAHLDSLQFARSKFLKYVSDSIFLESFMNAYLEEIRALGGRACLDGPNPGCEGSKISYVVNFLHTELKEYAIKYTDIVQMGDQVYEKDIPLEGISFHLWLEIHPLEDTFMIESPLYAENNIRDELDRSEYVINENSGQVMHIHKKSKLSQQKIYQMAHQLGKKYASYTWDHLLNIYVRQTLKSATPWLHYDRSSGKYIKTNTQKFRLL